DDIAQWYVVIRKLERARRAIFPLITEGAGHARGLAQMYRTILDAVALFEQGHTVPNVTSGLIIKGRISKRIGIIKLFRSWILLKNGQSLLNLLFSFGVEIQFGHHPAQNEQALPRIVMILSVEPDLQTKRFFGILV